MTVKYGYFKILKLNMSIERNWEPKEHKYVVGLMGFEMQVI